MSFGTHPATGQISAEGGRWIMREFLTVLMTVWVTLVQLLSAAPTQNVFCPALPPQTEILSAQFYQTQDDVWAQVLTRRWTERGWRLEYKLYRFPAGTCWGKGEAAPRSARAASRKHIATKSTIWHGACGGILRAAARAWTIKMRFVPMKKEVPDGLPFSLGRPGGAAPGPRSLERLANFLVIRPFYPSL